MAVKVLETFGLPHKILGQVGGDHLTILMPKQRLQWSLESLRAAWANTLREVLP
jgi:phosphoribosylformylglycinamidine synthase